MKSACVNVPGIAESGERPMTPEPPEPYEPPTIESRETIPHGLIGTDGDFFSGTVDN